MGNIFPNYITASTNQYIVKTGLSIDTVKITKSTFKFPFQKAICVDINPQLYEFDLYGSTNDKFEFIIKCVVMMGPDVMTGDIDLDKGNLTKYVTFLNPYYNDKKYMHPMFLNIAENILHTSSAKIKLNELINNFYDFKVKFIDNFQKNIEQYGLKIFNINIKNIKDFNDNKYLGDMLTEEKIKIIEENTMLSVAKINAEKNIDIVRLEKDLYIESVKNKEQINKIGEYITCVNNSFANDNESTIKFINGIKSPTETQIQSIIFPHVKAHSEMKNIVELMEPAIKKIKETTGLDALYTYNILQKN